jgi:hypothetical protein
VNGLFQLKEWQNMWRKGLGRGVHSYLNKHCNAEDGRHIRKGVVDMIRKMTLTILCAIALANSAQHTWFDQEIYWNGSGWHKSDGGQDNGFSSPTNWVSPSNYSAGTMYRRMEIISKPSDLPVVTQTCIWGNVETCSGCSNALTAPSVVITWDSPANNWWVKEGGSLNWASAGTYQCAVVLKETSCSGLWVDNGSGSWCMPGSVAEHVPIRMRYTAILVSQGSAFVPPSNWKPYMQVAPFSLSFTGGAGGQNPNPRQARVVNMLPQAGTLAAVSGSASYENGSGWIEVSVAGVAADTQLITTTVNLAGLAAGTYRGSVNVTATNAEPSTISIPVLLNVTPATGVRGGAGAVNRARLEASYSSASGVMTIRGVPAAQ